MTVNRDNSIDCKLNNPPEMGDFFCDIMWSMDRMQVNSLALGLYEGSVLRIDLQGYTIRDEIRHLRKFAKDFSIVESPSNSVVVAACGEARAKLQRDARKNGKLVL